MSVKYTYSISLDFPNQKVYIPTLTTEIQESSITATLEYIDVAVSALDNCDIFFNVALTAGEQTTLNGIVAAHTGIGYVSTIMGTTDIADEGKILTEVGPAWGSMGGVVTSPGFFNPDMNQLMGRILGEIKTDGAGAEVKIIETTDLGVEKDMSAVTALPDTAGVWQKFRLDTNTPPTDATWNRYEFVGRKNAVANVEIRFMTFSLLQVIPV